MLLTLIDSDRWRLLQTPWPWVFLVAVYLLGAVPFGLVLARRVKGVDLRTIGSGNIGTSNAVRAMGRRWGFVVFALDFLKGYLPTLLCTEIVPSGAEHADLLKVLTGTAAVLGHCFPVYLRFKGGKGVATGLGAMVAIAWPVFLYGGIVWLLARLVTGYAGLASILMGLTFPIAIWFHGGREHPELFVGALLLTLLIVVRHRSNIQRMLRGTEPNAKKRKAAERGAASAESKTEPKKRQTARRHG